MADEEQVEILRRGVEVWNAWREEHGVILDLSYADLSGAGLNGASLSHANLRYADLSYADLSYTNLRYADLKKANLRYANLNHANLNHANLNHATLNRANPSFADLSDANLNHADLNCANLRYANLSFADLNSANLNRASLTGTNLTGAILNDADLSRVELFGASLDRASLIGAIFNDAILKDLVIGGSSLEKTKGLESGQHIGPSTIGQNTLELSKGKIPEEFLRGCGFQDWEVESARLHDPELSQEQIVDITYKITELRAQAPLQIGSIFISYNETDSAFVDALEMRLDKAGIRTWRDNRDLVVGPIEKQIERAIQLNRIVLLVLSEHSIKSDWVEWEVRKAAERRKELQETKRKQVHNLCPVALDGAWKDSHWPDRMMKDLMEYLVLDYSQWQDKDFFEGQYKKLEKGLGIYYRDE